MSTKKVIVSRTHENKTAAMCCHDSKRVLANGNVKSAIMSTNSATLRGNNEKMRTAMPIPAPTRRNNSTSSTHHEIPGLVVSVSKRVVTG